MKISISQTKVHDKKDFVAKFYIEKNQNQNFNVLLVDSLKGHYKTRLKNATRLYFVIGGSGKFIVDGKSDLAEKDDLFIISAGETYEYFGEMRLLEINVPATDSSNEEKIE